MSKTVKFTLVSLFILLTRSYDAYATYQFTPDLSKEANPLSSVLGLDWLPLLLIIGSLTIYCLYACYVSTFKGNGSSAAAGSLHVPFDTSEFGQHFVSELIVTLVKPAAQTVCPITG